MTMEKEANYFVVGLFVSLSLLGVVGFLIWLAGVHTSGHYARYTIYFTDPVSGLYDEADVKYKGVEVGKILAMRITPERSDLIKVDIEVKDDTPVHATTLAKVEMQGITGQSYIELVTDRADAAPAPRMDDEKYPVLKGRGSAFVKLFNDLPEITRQLQSTLSAIDEFSRGSTKAVESIRGLADKLKEDPSQIIRPPSNKGVEIPKK
jgi:phospholipid/cholesterol/gamma-HCH transport system substrate-binding protein